MQQVVKLNIRLCFVQWSLYNDNQDTYLPVLLWRHQFLMGPVPTEEDRLVLLF
jgi:hypothetical protein